MWNNLDKLGSNRIKTVYYWREVVTVTIKHLKKKKKEQNNKIRATKINSEKKKKKTPENYCILGRFKRVEVLY